MGKLIRAVLRGRGDGNITLLPDHIRHYPTPNSARSGYKLLSKPSPDSIQQIKRKLKGLWRKHVGSPSVALIHEMTPLIRGGSTYFRIGVAKEVFTA